MLLLLIAIGTLAFELKNSTDYQTQSRELEIKEAQKNGTWAPGLDSNRHLFKEVDNEARKQLEELAKKIDKVE